MDKLPLGRISGHRGRGGELTVKVLGGDGSLWTELPRVWIEATSEGDGQLYSVESSRAYADRLVLKLEGIDSAEDAAALRGHRVLAPETDAPALPDGVYYVDKLIGMEVRDESGLWLGRVGDVIRTGGTDVLVVHAPVDGPDEHEKGSEQEPEEILIPLARRIVIEVREDAGRITVRPPEGLLELNRRGQADESRDGKAR